MIKAQIGWRETEAHCSKFKRAIAFALITNKRTVPVIVCFSLTFVPFQTQKAPARKQKRASEIWEMHRRESAAELRLKLTSMVARHQEMKTAFINLKSQINVGLLQVYTLVLHFPTYYFFIHSFDYDIILFVTNTTTNQKFRQKKCSRR